MIISCSSLTKTFDGKDVLKDITFMMDDHDKMAIIGVNGAGKSTLLRIIQNNESYDSGSLSIPNDVKIGYLSQEHRFDLDKGIYETLEEPFENLIQIEKRMRELEMQMGDIDHLETIMNEYDKLQARFNDEGGYAM